MQHIEVSIIIANSADSVYAMIKDMKSFPDFMRDVKTLKIIKSMPDKIITAWEVEIEGVSIKWEEEDIFNDKKLELNFNAIGGDYKQYQGKWIALRKQDQTRLTIEADLDLGSPILEKYVGKALEKRARLSLLGMLKAIKNKLE